MKVAFIACEYNPFHNGHKHHISETRKNGADAIVCIMSGNFVQRGSPALIEKHKRAQMALEEGADVVIELPLRYAIATAPLFAEGFVRTAAATGLQGFISFGCTTEISKLYKIRTLLDSKDAQEVLSSAKSEAISYPKLINEYIKNVGKGEFDKILNDANNILALEYIKSRNLYFDKADIVTVERIGANHDSMTPSGNFSSATYIRELLDTENNTDGFLSDAKKLMPDNAFSILADEIKNGHYTDKDLFSRVFFSRILNIAPDELIHVNNVSGGIENRITESIRSSAALNEVYDKVKSKRYPHSRIRQILLSSALGIMRDDYKDDINYLRILGCSLKGREVLRMMKDSTEMPIIMNMSQLDTNNETIKKQAKADYLSAKLFDLCTISPIGGNPDYDIPPVILNK